jgi:hypothetical protein
MSDVSAMSWTMSFRIESRISRDEESYPATLFIDPPMFQVNHLEM